MAHEDHNTINTVEEIIKNIGSQIITISKHLQNHYHDLSQHAHSKIKSLISDLFVDACELEAQHFAFEFRNGYNITSTLVAELKSMNNVEQLAEILKTAITKLSVQVPEDAISNIAAQSKHLSLINVASDKCPREAWAELFQGVLNQLSNSKQDIRKDTINVAEKLRHGITSSIHGLVKGLKEHYIQKMKSLEIKKLPSALHEDYNIIAELMPKLRKLTNAQDLSKELSQYTRKINTNADEISNHISTIYRRGKYLTYLQILINEKLSIWIPEWTVPLDTIETRLFQSEKWYQFLNDLHAKLSEYRVQGDKNKYNVARIEDWGQGSESQGLTITSSTFKPFLNKIKDFNISEYDIIKNIQATDLQLQELNQLLNLTLKDNITTQCSQKALTVKGNYIKFSDFVNKDGKLINACANSTKPTCLEIFALNTVFFDTDLRSVADKLQLAILAPKWETIGTREIVLDGNTASEHIPPKAKNSTHRGIEGEHGKPGLPGGPSGSFLGIGEVFANSYNLRISANGGTGGPGQHGGDGARGKPGENALYPSKNCEIYGKHEIQTVYDSDAITKHTTYQIYGSEGGKGGDGGNGGKGGVGGNPGAVRIIRLARDIPRVAVSTRVGNVGAGGRGGAGALGGSSGKDLIVTCRKNRIIGIIKTGGKLETATETLHIPSAGPPGQNGSSDENSADMKPAEPPVTVQEPASIINRYKSYLQESLKENARFVKDSLIRFFDQLNNNTDTMAFYDTLALVHELHALEERSNSLAKEDLLHFYHSLLRRIDKYSETRNPSEISDQQTTVLKYLYTATYTKIYNLKMESESNLVLDMSKYLDIVGRNIEKLENLQSKNDELAIINEYKGNYKANLDKKIEEATKFIDTEIVAEIESISAHVDKSIESQIELVISLQERAQSTKIRQMKEKQRLKEKMVYLRILNTLKDVGLLLTVINPMFTIVNRVFGVTDWVIEKFTANEKNWSEGLPQHIIQEIYNGVEFLTATSKPHEEKDDEPADTTSNKLLQAINVVKLLNTKYKDIRQIYKDHVNNNPENSLSSVEEAIESAKSALQQYEENEIAIYSTIIPLVKRMKDYLTNTASQLRNQSKVSLDITRWDVQSSLTSVKSELQRLMNGISTDRTLSHYIDNLQEAMTILINTYDRIQNYQEQQTLANYLADITSASVVKVADPKLNEAFHHLDSVIRSNLVLQQYKTATDAFKQWVFPFAHLYSDEILLPKHLQLETNVRALVSNAVTHLERIKSKVDIYNKASITGIDEYISTGAFSSGYVSVRPFFVWKSEHHNQTIAKLISGEEAVLNADIKYSPPDKDAIKFNVLSLDFKTKNNTLQTQLNHVLKEFKMRLTHLGNSYYRYDEKIYVIPSDSHTIEYSFEKNAIEEPVYKNNVYDKLKTGNLMLSPYAAWKMALISVTSDASFRQLQMYKNQIYLELTGHGSYVSKTRNIPSFLVERQYQVIDIVPQPRRNATKFDNATKPIKTDGQIRENIQHKNKSLKSWFSWMKFPSFNILPVAQAVAIEDGTSISGAESICDKSEALEHGAMSLLNVLTPFVNCMKSIWSNLPKSTSSNPPETILSHYADYILRDTSNPIAQLAIDFDSCKEYNVQEPTYTCDLNSNLALGQLIAHKMFGSNKSLNTLCYLSPTQVHNIRIDELASEILPILENNYLHEYFDNYIVSSD